MESQTLTLDFIRAIAEVNASFHSSALAFGQREGVRAAASHYLTPSSLNRGALLGSDGGVSIDLTDGSVVDFWLELWHENSSWRISEAIYKHDPTEEGVHTVALLFEGTFPDLREALVVLGQRAKHLTSSTDLPGNPFPYSSAQNT